MVLFIYFSVPHLNYSNCDPQGKHICIFDVFSSVKTKEIWIKSLFKPEKKMQKVKVRSASAGIKVSECDADVFLTHSDAKLGKWWKD